MLIVGCLLEGDPPWRAASLALCSGYETPGHSCHFSSYCTANKGAGDYLNHRHRPSILVLCGRVESNVQNLFCRNSCSVPFVHEIAGFFFFSSRLGSSSLQIDSGYATKRRSKSPLPRQAKYREACYLPQYSFLVYEAVGLSGRTCSKFVLLAQ